MVGEIIDCYRLLDELGQGGMGVVYRAEDTFLEKIVALKMMHPMLARDERFLRRFRSEAKALGRLHHPHIVNVYAFRQEGDRLFIVMEYVDGSSLAQTIRERGPMPWPEAVPIIRQSLDAMAFAHEQHVIHRDIKPSNILITRTGTVKITDFGLAKIQDAALTRGVTQTGMTGGSLYYMSPEQLDGLTHVDHRGDIYSLGMTYYEMLAGRSPFAELSSEFAVLKAIDAHDFPPLRDLRPDVPDELARIIGRAVERDPNDRFQSAREMLDALESRADPPDVDRADQTLTDISALRGRQRDGRGPANASPRPGGDPPFPSGAPTLLAAEDRPPARPRKPSRLRRAALPAAAVLLAGVVLTLALRYVVFRDTPVATLTLRSEPPGAEATVNGRAAGITPLPAYEVAPGRVDVHLEKPGYRTLDTVLTIEAGAVPRLAFNLEALPDSGNGRGEEEQLAETGTVAEADPTEARTGTLRIDSSPRGAEILLDGTSYGTTPRTIEDAEASEHVLTLRLEGREPYTANIRVDAGRTRTVAPTLAALAGTIQVGVNPWGRLFVDGEVVIEQLEWPQTITLQAGRRTVVVEHPTYGRFQRSMRIAPGEAENRPLIVDFTRSAGITVVVQDAQGRPMEVAGEILVDGRSVGGPVPRRIDVPVGWRTIDVRAEGFESVPVELNVEPDHAEPVAVTLRRTP